MNTVLIVLHVIVCFFLIAVVLLQRGKGAPVELPVGIASGPSHRFTRESKNREVVPAGQVGRSGREVRD